MGITTSTLTPRVSSSRQLGNPRASHPQVTPSPVPVGRPGPQPHSLHQELLPFATWTEDPLWVPPKDCSRELAETMLRRTGLCTPRERRWEAVIEGHRDQFTQVRQIELAKASIRLPKGRLFVSVTEQKHFDRITEEIPGCVQTRLDDFLAGPGKSSNAKVDYLKPLCIEIDDQLHFTSRGEIDAAISKIRGEVDHHFHRLYLPNRLTSASRWAAVVATAIPRSLAQSAMERRHRGIEAYQAKLDFQRRRMALAAQRVHLKCRTDGCRYDEMLALTNPLEQTDVIEQYSIERKLSQAERTRLLRIAAGHMPWFVTLSMTLYAVATVAVTWATPVAVCDPAFVAEFPGSNGELFKIGHFDDIAGVRHMELQPLGTGGYNNPNDLRPTQNRPSAHRMTTAVMG